MLGELSAEERAKRLENPAIIFEKPLPVPAVVEMPFGIPNETFGDVAMVTEFLHSFRKLFVNKLGFPISTELLLQSVTSWESGFEYISQILISLLNVLITKLLSKNLKVMGVRLCKLPINKYTANELTRLCFHYFSRSLGRCEAIIDAEVAQFAMSRLNSNEIYQLDACDQLRILVAMCNCILSSQLLCNFVIKSRKKAIKFGKEVVHINKENKKKATDVVENESNGTTEHKEIEVTGNITSELKSDAKEQVVANILVDRLDNKIGIPLDNFYGKMLSSLQGMENTEVDAEGKSILSTIQHRRLELKKASEQRDEEERRLEEEKKCTKNDALKIRFERAFAECKSMIRLAPLGTDRNGTQYWYFRTSLHGIYLQNMADKNRLAIQIKEPEGKGDGSLPSTVVIEDAKGPDISDAGNVWFYYATPTDIDDLVASLSQIDPREKALRKEIRNTLMAIKHKACTSTISFVPSSKHLSDSNFQLNKIFRDLNKVLKIRGRGGVFASPKWNSLHTNLQTLSDYTQLAIELHESINPEAANPYAALDEWRSEVESCGTLSKMHVLVHIFQHFMQWDALSNDVKCRVCQRPSNEKQMLFCDDCNSPYHTFCLTPSLDSVPNSAWYCKPCNAKYNYLSTKESETDGSRICHICCDYEATISCPCCHKHYHPDCHKPPFRHHPRGAWTCMRCTGRRKLRTFNAGPDKYRTRYGRATYTK